MLFNYGGNNLKTIGSGTLQTNTQTVSNMTMSNVVGSRCGGYSMRSTMHSKTKPKTRCGACGGAQ